MLPVMNRTIAISLVCVLRVTEPFASAQSTLPADNARGA
jgi:hypothetical protein